MDLGIVGTGTIAAAIIEGLLSCDDAGRDVSKVLVSPRGADVAADLARRFARVEVASSNQAVVDGCQTVVLSVRPQIAEEVIRSLRFRPGQRIISLIAATQIEVLQRWIGLDLPIVRAIPLPFVSVRRGVTPIFPPDAQAQALFDRLGTAIPCTSLAEFDLLAIASALMGSTYGIMEVAQGWLEAQGLPAPAARSYLAGLMANLGRVAEEGSVPFIDLRAEYSTKGGLNEQMFRVFSEQGGGAALTAALDSVASRLRG
jgi:pyrroline-5-carboxylate reductase